MIPQLRASFARARDRGFAQRFYAIFLARDARARAMFAKTDFSRQHQLLEHGIFALLDFAEGKTLGRIAIARLGKIHNSDTLRIPHDLYNVWIECVMEVVTELDSDLTPALAVEWRKALDGGVAALIKAGEAPAGRPPEPSRSGRD